MRKKSWIIRFQGWKGLLALAAFCVGTLSSPGTVRAEKPCFLDGWLQWVAELQASDEVPTSCRAKDRCCEFACPAKSEPCEAPCRSKPGIIETACPLRADSCAISCVKPKPVYSVRVIQERVDPCDHCPCAPDRPSGVHSVNQDNVHFRLATFVQQANHRAMMQNHELHHMIKEQNQQIQQLSNNMETLLHEIQNLQQQVQTLRNQPPLFVPPPPPPLPSYPQNPQMPIPYYVPTAPVQFVPSSYQTPSYPVPPPAPMLPASYPNYNYWVPAPAPQQYPLPPQGMVPPAVPVTSVTEPVLPSVNSSSENINSYIGLFR